MRTGAGPGPRIQRRRHGPTNDKWGRVGYFDPVVPTRFDQLLARLSLPGWQDAASRPSTTSHPLVQEFVARHWDRYYVPEELLRQLGRAGDYERQNCGEEGNRP